MRKRMEVHALQQAVCKLIVLLDNVFAGELEGWGRNNCGLKVEVRPVEKANNAYLEIRPAGWPKKSFIFARFDGDDEEGWGLEEGQIVAPHIRIADNTDCLRVSFEVPNFSMPYRTRFKVVDKGTPSAEIFRQLAAKAGLLEEVEPPIGGIREAIEKCKADEQELNSQAEKARSSYSPTDWVYGGATFFKEEVSNARIALLRRAVDAIDKLTDK